MTTEVPLESLPPEQQVEMLMAALNAARARPEQEIAQPVIHLKTAFAMYAAAALQGLLACPEAVGQEPETIIALSHLYASRMIEGPQPEILERLKGAWA